MKKFGKAIGSVVIVALIAWFVVSQIVFAIRHPWASETERLVYIGHALTFQKVDYREARPRD